MLCDDHIAERRVVFHRLYAEFLLLCLRDIYGVRTLCPWIVIGESFLGSVILQPLLSLKLLR